jgi:quinoprotein glucose dehydrogenase
LLLAGLLTLAVARSAGAATLEDPQARAALPEFKVIPAAKSEELTPAAKISMAPFGQWTRSHGDNGARRYSTLTQINRDNVKSLERAWTYHSNDITRSGAGAAGNIECTPIIVDGIMYGPTPGRALVAVDAATGVEHWRLPMEQPARLRPQDEPAYRGLVYWPGDRDNAPRILFGCGDWIFAVDPKTGKARPEFGDAGRTAIPTGAVADGAIYHYVYATTGKVGDVYGYDVRTGKMLWRFKSQSEEFGSTAGGNGWCGLSLDDQRGIAFVALGNPSPTMVGIDRPGDNLFSNCVVALDVMTGKRLWHFQTVAHDLWDLDVVGQPNLVTITRDGRRVDAVTGFSKGGTLLLLDRVSGKPIFPFRLRRAPVSTLPGERTAPYQPDPEMPEQISPMEFSLADVTDRTPEAREFVLKVVQQSNYGFYPAHIEGKSTLFVGSRGGAEWSGAAVDVPTGRLYVTSNRWVSKITVMANDDRGRDPKYPPSAGEKHYDLHCAACHGPTRAGIGIAPPLVGLKNRMKDADVLTLLATGRATMPANLILTVEEKNELLDFLFRRNQPPARKAAPTDREFGFDGFKFLVDHEGYPGIKPPWGLLNCFDLNTGKALWRVPLGELDELTQKGTPITGSQNLGGATVTAGGLVFVAGTEDEKIRAFDADTGRELWQAKLPFAGTAAPAVYEVGGRKFVVITATGGGRVGGASGKGDTYVAFALKE